MADSTCFVQSALNKRGVVIFPAGDYLICRTLIIYSDTEVVADENARFILDGNYMKHRGDFLLTNSDHKNGNKNIKIIGGIWDGNNQGEYNTKPHLFDKDGYSGAVLNFFNIDGFELSNMTVANSVTYNIRMSKLENFKITDIKFFSQKKAFNQDGLHFGGCVKNGVVKNISAISKGQTNDDLIALNADDSIERIENFDILRGDIENITFENIYAQDCHTLVRFLSVEAAIRNITIKNISGGCRNFAVNMDAARYCKTPLFNDTEYKYGVGKIENISIENMNVYWTKQSDEKALILCESNAENFTITGFNRDFVKDKCKRKPTLLVRNISNSTIQVKHSEDKETKQIIKFKYDEFVLNESFESLSINKQK